MTLNAVMITVCSMFNYDTTGEQYNHDPQTFYNKFTDNIIANYVGFKPYA